MKPNTNQILELLRKPLTRITAGDAADLVEGLGPAAPWLLRDEALDRLAEDAPWFADLPRPYKPSLPIAAGSCCIIYALPEPTAYPLLREAFLLPLQWRREGFHDPCLPAQLCELADRVRRHLDLAGCWSLHRLAPFHRFDLSRFDGFLKHESGWPALAGGLLLLKDEQPPRCGVWATGTWHADSGIQDAGYLQAKLTLATQWGAELVFIPEGQAVPAGCRMHVGTLKRGLQAPTEVLSDYLVSLRAPPPQTASRKDRRKFYLSQPPRHPLAVDFYRTRLLADVIADRRQQIATDWPGWAPTHLVTVVSDSPELIPLAAGALGVSHCLLLHADSADSNKMKERAAEAKQQLAADGLKVVLHPFDYGDETKLPAIAASIGEAIAAFAADVDQDKLVFDSTPGYKLLTLVLAQLARHSHAGAWLIHVRHQKRGGHVIPFTERLERWQAGGAGAPFADLRAARS